MHRVKRQPSIFGTVDLADQVALEFNVPLDRLSEKFSFESATRRASDDQPLMYGRRAERIFEYVVASLGKADLITAEDGSAPLYSGSEVQAPDYFVSLKTGKKFFVEVKNTQPKNLHTAVNFGKAYLSRLKKYAELKGHPLLIAVYWNGLSTWTINKVEDFETKNETINLRFIDALQKNIAGDFGDRMIATVPPLTCRIYADANCPSSIENDSQAKFTINSFRFYTEQKEILNERERQIAFYLMFHSSWTEDTPVATMDGDRVKYIEINARQSCARSTEQEFEFLGSLGGMVSNYYKWLTTADEKIIRLTPQLTPSQLAPGFDDAYQGEVLRIWQFELQPSYEPLHRQSK